MKVFEYQLLIQEHHLDTFGHVNNATYLELYEEARWDFITVGGWGLDRIRRDQVGPVILEANVKFKRELVNRELIKIVSQSRDIIAGKLLTIGQQMIKPDGKVASEALFTVGIMDLKERKLIMPTPDWLSVCGYE